MTQATNSAQGQSLFSPRTLEHVHAELLAEMYTLKERNPTLHAEASRLFKENPDAKTHVGAAEALLVKVRDLSRPAAPAPENPLTDLFALDDAEDAGETALASASVVDVTEVAQVQSPAPQISMDEEEATEDDEEQDSEDEHAEDPEPETVPPAETTPTPVEVPKVSWPDGTLGEGLISQLAQTLMKGETVSFVLTRTGDQLLVTVQPNPIKDESATTVIPLQAKDTPARLDEQLAAAFNDYVLGRQIARETVVASYAEKVKAAAKSAKKPTTSSKTAGKPPATPSRSNTNGRLHVELSPKSALGILTDANGKTHPFTAGTYLDLPPGSYTLNIDAEGYESREEKLLVKPGKDTKTAFVLPKAPEPSLFAN